MISKVSLKHFYFSLKFYYSLTLKPYKLSEKFFLEHNWKTDASDVNQIEILRYRLNDDYYKSDEFFGNLIESRKSISSYLSELKDLKIKYMDLKSLCIDEIS